MIYIALTSTEAGMDEGGLAIWTHASSSPHPLCTMLFISAEQQKQNHRML